MTAAAAPRTLTRVDKATGQRLFDYQLVKVVGQRGDGQTNACRQLPDGSWEWYSLRLRVIRRYEIV